MILALRLNVAVALVLVLALGLTSMLAFLQFERTLEQTQASRFSVIAVNVQQTIADLVSPGLAIAEASGIDRVLERALEVAPEVEEVLVFNPQGRILFAAPAGDSTAGGSTAGDSSAGNATAGDPGEVTRVDDAWLATNREAGCASASPGASEVDSGEVPVVGTSPGGSEVDLSRGRGALWTRPGEVPVVGSSLCNSSNAIVAGIALSYRPDRHDGVAGRLARMALVVLVAALGVSTVVTYLVLQPTTRVFARMGARARGWRQDAPPPADAPAATALEADLLAFRERAHEAIAALDAAESEKAARG